MYYEIGREIIYSEIIKQYIQAHLFKLNELSDATYSLMRNELVNLSDNELITQLGRINEISSK